MNRKLLIQASMNGILCFVVGFGLVLLAGGFKPGAKRPIDTSPEIHDPERVEEVT